MAISYTSLAAPLTQKFAEFTATGTFTSPANVTTVEVLLVAGGGGCKLPYYTAIKSNALKLSPNYIYATSTNEHTASISIWYIYH